MNGYGTVCRSERGKFARNHEKPRQRVCKRFSIRDEHLYRVRRDCRSGVILTGLILLHPRPGVPRRKFFIFTPPPLCTQSRTAKCHDSAQVFAAVRVAWQTQLFSFIIAVLKQHLTSAPTTAYGDARFDKRIGYMILLGY